jgi:hypothetical protein
VKARWVADGAARVVANTVCALRAQLWVDPNGSLILPIASSELRRADLPMPIPRNPGLVGGTVFVQTVWLGPTGPSPCPPLGLSASFGLKINIQP